MKALRATLAALRALGWALLGLAALAGLLLSAAALFATSPWGRPVVASAVVRRLDAALAGRLELEGVAVLPQGGVELRGVRVFDPEDRLVLAVDRARVFAEVMRLRSGELGLVAELEGPSVLLDEDEDGGLSLVRAFAPARPSAEPPGEDEGGGPPLAIRISRLTVRNGNVWWVDREGETRVEASGLDVDARGLWSGPRAELELRLRGEAEAPVAGALGAEVVLTRRGDALSVPLLSLFAGGTAVALAGKADLAARSGRAAVVRFAVDRAQARALAPAAGEGADLEGAAYAESDGRVATAAVAFAPREGGEASRAEAAVAVALDGARALGFDVAAQRVDPSRLHADAPAGEVTLTARGAATLARSLDTLEGEIDVALSPSRLRGGRLGPATLAARAARGLLRVDRLDLQAPGVRIAGAGSWREGGAVSGKLTADAEELRVALANVAALLGEKLPVASGRLRVDAVLTGTTARPTLVAHAEAPALRAFDVGARGLELDAELTGPLASPTGKLAGAADALSVGGAALARSLRIEAGLEGDEVRLDLHAGVPALGDDPFRLEALGRLGPRREGLALSALALSYPGTRLALARPAAVSFAGPAVDRLELADGTQRIAIEGGLGRRGALDARVEVSGLELARLPRGLLPPAFAGTVALDARATGTTARPQVQGEVRLARGAYRALTGLDAGGELRWDGARRRVGVRLGVRRAKGGEVDLSGELPVPLDAPGEVVALKLRAERIPVEDLLALAEVDVAAEGVLALDVALEGTTRAPRLEATLELADAAYEDFFPIAARVRLADAGDRLDAKVDASLDGRPALALEAGWPLALADVLDDPAAALEALPGAPMEATARVPGLDLAALAGTLGLPADLVGSLTADATLDGTIRAPRGKARVELAGGALAGYRGVGAEADVTLASAAVKLAGRIGVAGAELARLEGSLGAAPEALLEPARLRRAPLVLDVVIPEGTLARATGDAVPLAGTLRGTLAARGSLGAPELEVALAGKGVEVEGRPLGDATATARYAAGRTTAAVDVRGARGGTLRVTGALDAAFGLGVESGALGDRPVELRLVAEALDLGVVPALAPGVVRSAAGRLDADVAARGRLARPSPRGSVRVSGGRLAVSEYGDWTDLALDFEVTDDAVELRRAEARRGPGKVSASGALRGLGSGQAKLEGKLRSEALTVIRGGMPLATFDLEANATGTYAADRLEVLLRVPRGVVRLPDKLPRELQSVERRADIVVGKPKEPRRKPRATGRAAAPARAEPFTLVARLLAPDQLFVRSENPRIDLELQADVTYELRGTESYAEGSVEVLRGYVEPIGGRTFQMERGRVQFTGGPPTAALLDVQARYDNPAAKVTVNVTGPVLDPEIRLSSQPPMDDAQIAMLIATGRTELKPGGGGVGTITGEEAGKAALSVLATQAFKNLVADKLPLDTVALDSSTLRAGKYVTDKIYVGYTRRFDADPERGENPDEVRVEYQITPRWTFESRYGNAQSGGASLVWSRDY